MGNTAAGSLPNPAETAKASKRPHNKMKAIHMRLLRIKNRGKSGSAKIHHQQAAAATLHETKEVTAINSMLTEEEIKNIQVHTC